jgi:nitrous oxidase accessory protein NosD
MRIRWATVPVVAGATVVLTAAAAFGATIMVDHDGLASPGNCNGTAPAATTIQQGVNQAAPGDTVEVCGGGAPYAGAVVNTPSVHLLGVSNPVVTEPAGTAITLNGNNDTISKFTITGSQAGITTSPLASGYLITRNNINNNAIGIFLGSDGTTQTLVTRNVIDSNNGPGAASGTGIYSDVPLHNATISFNKFNNNDNEQINITPNIAASDTGINIQHNTFTNGNNSDVAFCPGCASGVNDSTISNNKMSDPHDPAGGSTIYIGGTSSNDTLQSNKITNSNFNGISIRENAGSTGPISIVSNKITTPVNNGIDVTSPSSDAVNATSNRVTNPGNFGIHLGAGTTGNRLTSNHAKGAPVFNCVDESSPLANTWTNDHSAPSNPPGICT